MTHPTMYEVDAIHIMHIIKVRGYQDFNVLLLQSGIVIRSTKFIGQVINHQIRSHFDFGQFVIFTISTRKQKQYLTVFYNYMYTMYTTLYVFHIIHITYAIHLLHSILIN